MANTSKGGFASMEDDRQRRTSRKGSEASHGGRGSGEHAASGSVRHGERGFAAMDEVKQREIASEGGKAAHEKGTAHEFNSAEAREAGRKGGETVSKDRAHMSEIGRKGGESRRSRSRGARTAGAKKDK